MPDEPPTVDRPTDSPTGPHPAGQSTDARFAGWVGNGPAPEGPPGYELLAEVGRGGMGVVYRARDVRMGREVAVKLLADRYPPHGTAARRFAAEARITGRLQHPGIPPVHEVGQLDNGRPFLAMKLIQGVTLAELLAGNPEPGRLVAAFEGVCQAVAYAHSKGVIHRDLKPANVMLGAFGEVQVMDWGLAKVLADGPNDPDATGGGTDVSADRVGSDPTQDGHALGTPAYMPPEQAVGAVADMDRRTDVFGLGAVLCHLLTGRPPFVGRDAEGTRQLAARGDLADALGRLAGSGADPELRALCERCLTPDSSARPADAGAVAAEVAAWRQAADERARRAEVDRAAAEVRAGAERARRRLLAVAGGLVVAVTALGAAAAGVLWRRAAAHESATAAALADKTAEERAKAAALAEATAQRAAADRAAATATDATVTAESFADFLVKGFLAAARPAGLQGGLGPGVTVADALEQAEARIPALLGDRPWAEYRARHAVGVTWRHLGRYPAAERNLRRAVDLAETQAGRDAPAALASVNSLAVLFLAQGRHPEAVALFRRALAGHERADGPSTPAASVAARNLGAALLAAGDPAAAEPLLRRALAGLESAHGPDHPETVGAAERLGVLCRVKGDLEAAEPLLRRALAGAEAATGPDHPSALEAANNLGVLYLNRRKYAAAEPLLRRATAGLDRAAGPDHRDSLTTAYNLALVLEHTGRDAEAEPLLRRVAAGTERAYGADHPVAVGRASSLGVLLWRLRRPEKAVPLLEGVLRRRRARDGEGHPDTLETMANLGVAYKDSGRAVEAVPLLERAYGGRTEHPALTWTWEPLADAYARCGRRTDGARVAQLRLAEGRRLNPPGSPGLGQALADAGKALLALDPAAAEPVLRECVAVRGRLAAASWATANARSLLGEALLLQRKLGEAESELVAGYAGLVADRDRLPAGSSRNLPAAAERLVRLYRAMRRPDEAARWRAERAKYPAELAPWPRPAQQEG